LKCSVRTNRFECDKLDQYTKRENCRIHNLSVAWDTDLTEQVIDLFNHLSDLATKDGSTETRVNADTARQFKPFCSSNISVCHRVKPKHGSKQQIIVRFVSRNKFYDVFRSKKYLKSSPRYKGVFITDDLTPLRTKLFDIVKKDGATSHNFGSGFVCVLLSGLFFLDRLLVILPIAVCIEISLWLAVTTSTMLELKSNYIFFPWNFHFKSETVFIVFTLEATFSEDPLISSCRVCTSNRCCFISLNKSLNVKCSSPPPVSDMITGYM